MKFTKLEEVLKERGISKRQLAKSIGIHCESLYPSLNGKRHLYPKYKRKISEFLDMPSAELFKEIENEQERREMYQTLKEKLKEKNLSKMQLALLTQINPPDLYSALNGKKEMFPLYKSKISKFFEMDVDELFPTLEE